MNHHENTSSGLTDMQEKPIPEDQPPRRWILAEEYSLRGWKGEPFFLERAGNRYLRKLTPDEFLYLIRCDGETAADPEAWPPQPEWAVREGFIVPRKDGQTLKPEQRYRLFPNRRFPYIDLALTGRCNFSCRHCFNAADCNPRSTEPSLDEILRLIGRLDECGVGRLRLTGGEPLIRKDFTEITGEIARRRMRVTEIATNGWFITDALLDKLKEQKIRPVWFISFDGLGFHDWLRGVEGAEEKTLEKIRLLCDRGYTVQVHQCVWKDSLSSVKPTVRLLQDIGVQAYRITTVEPSLRWMKSAPEQTIPPREWLGRIPDFLAWWYQHDIRMNLDIWGIWCHEYGTGKVRIIPDISAHAECPDQIPICGDARKMPFIDSDGRLLLCLGCSGITAAAGIEWGNVYRDDVQELLTDSAFTKQLACSCGELKAMNPECGSCRWHDRCGMGCRAEAMAQGNGLTGIDRRMCVFFRNGIYEKLVRLADELGLEHGGRPLNGT